MSTRLPVALLNYEAGGRIANGQYNFNGLARAFANVEEPPTAILLNEAKEWEYWGSTALNEATNALAEQLGRPYVGMLGAGSRGPASTPALIYDPQIIRIDYWGDGHSTVHPDKRNFARAHVAGHTAAKFCISIQHWPHHSGDARLEEARLVKGYAKGPPTLLGGDLNSTASGPHILPKMDWAAADEDLRESKALEMTDGTWVDDTRALDLLIGKWDEQRDARMSKQVGWHALAELAHKQGMPAEQAFVPTVNEGIDAGGSMLIDWLLVNEAWREGLVPNTYAVHVPPSRPYPSDHRLVTATLEI